MAGILDGTSSRSTQATGAAQPKHGSLHLSGGHDGNLNKFPSVRLLSRLDSLGVFDFERLGDLRGS